MVNLHVSLMLGVARVLCEDHATANKTVLADLMDLGLTQGVKSTCVQLFSHPFPMYYEYVNVY